MIHCTNCHKPLSPQEKAAYSDRCEDCWCYVPCLLDTKLRVGTPSSSTATKYQGGMNKHGSINRVTTRRRPRRGGRE